jgi:hypothetical protein
MARPAPSAPAEHKLCPVGERAENAPFHGDAEAVVLDDQIFPAHPFTPSPSRPVYGSCQAKWTTQVAPGPTQPPKIELLNGLLQFFCTYWSCQPNAATMRSTPRVIVDLGKIPEICVIPVLAQSQANGRRAGLKIRSSQRGVGLSPTFGTGFGHLFSTTRIPLGATSEVVPSKVSRTWLMTPVRPSRFRARAGARPGSPRK